MTRLVRLATWDGATVIDRMTVDGGRVVRTRELVHADGRREAAVPRVSSLKGTHLALMARCAAAGWAVAE